MTLVGAFDVEAPKLTGCGAAFLGAFGGSLVVVDDGGVWCVRGCLGAGCAMVMVVVNLLPLATTLRCRFGITVMNSSSNVSDAGCGGGDGDGDGDCGGGGGVGGGLVGIREMSRSSISEMVS